MIRFDNFIDYFLIDYILFFGYNFVPSFKRTIQEVPINNQGKYDLIHNINKKYSDDLFNSITSGTIFFKTSRKVSLIPTINGYQTIFGYLEEKYNF